MEHSGDGEESGLDFIVVRQFSVRMIGGSADIAPPVMTT